MIIGFTGTSEGMSEDQKARLKELLSSMSCTTLHHGDCVGADAEAHDIAEILKVTNIIIHPPINNYMRANKKGFILPPKQYLVRNRDIVDACQGLIAAPRSNVEEQRSGTWATVRYARKIDRPVIILKR